MSSPHVVIIGAGFAGVAARERLLRDGHRVTLIDQHPYNTFQPLLYQVATGGLNPGDVTFPLRGLGGRRSDRARYRRATVTDVDTERRVVVCDDGVNIAYDYLIVSPGVKISYFGIPGAAEHSVSLYTRGDAIRARDTIFGGVERLAGAPHPEDAEYTIVVVGGGATGVEMAGTLAEMREVAIPRAFPELDPICIKVVLVEMAPSLLTPFHPSLQAYTRRQLEKRGVDIRLDTKIERVHPDRVDFADGTTLPTDVVVWAAGITRQDEVPSWGLPLGRGGRIEVEPDLRVVGHDRVFAAGDAAIVTENPSPQLAQPALQMGKHAAKQIDALIEGRPTVPFHYSDRGNMATIGALAAVVQFPWGGRFTGPPAWVLWIVVHLMYLLGGRNRIMTMINLASRYLTFRRTGAIVGDVMDTPAGRGRPRRDGRAAEPDEPADQETEFAHRA